MQYPWLALVSSLKHAYTHFSIFPVCPHFPVPSVTYVKRRGESTKMLKDLLVLSIKESCLKKKCNFPLEIFKINSPEVLNTKIWKHKALKWSSTSILTQHLDMFILSEKFWQKLLFSFPSNSLSFYAMPDGKGKKEKVKTGLLKISALVFKSLISLQCGWDSFWQTYYSLEVSTSQLF